MLGSAGPGRSRRRTGGEKKIPAPKRSTAPQRKKSRRIAPAHLPDIPIPLWEEDYSEVKRRVDKLRSSGITDWRTYWEGHPEEVHACLSLLRVTDVNPAALALFQYEGRENFLANPPLPSEKDWRNVMREELIALTEGRGAHESDLEMKTFDGEGLSIIRRVHVARGCEDDWRRVIVSPVDVSAHTRKERRLTTEVEWGSFLLELYETSSRLSERELFEHVLEQAVHFTDSRVGFFYFLTEDQKAVVLKSWVGELTVDLTGEEGVPIPIEKAGNWTDCILQKRPMVCRSSPSWRCVQGMPSSSAPVRRLLAVPVLDGRRVVSVLGVGNKEGPYEPRDMVHTQLLAYGFHRILKQRRAVEALTQREELFRLLTLHFPFPIAVFHEDGRAEFLNERFFSTFGYRLEDLPDQNAFWRLLIPEDGVRGETLALWRRAEEAAEQSGTDIELDGCRMRTRDGGERIVDLLGARIHSKRLLLLNDVTEHKRAEEETLRRTEELEVLAKISTAMRAAQSRAEIYSILVDQLAVLMKADGAVLALRDPESGESIVELGNRRWETLKGLQLPREAEPEGAEPASGGKGQPDAASAPLQLTRGMTAVAQAPLIANRKVIGTIWIGRSRPIGDHDIRMLTAIGEMAATAIQRQSLHEDLQIKLDALRQAQARLVQSEKLAAIGQLAAGIAHELNNPLTSVVLYSQLVQQEKLGGAVQGNLEKVVSEALRAGKIVRGLLDFARQRPIHREKVQVNEALRNSLDLITYEIESADVEIALDLSPGLPTISADHYQLTQVFMNLIQNSIHAMHAVAGRRDLKIATICGPSTYYVRGADSHTVVRVSIRDTGPGIPKEILTRIFDPFFTTKPESGGTGLGLSICHGIVGEHGGNIWAESSVGEGTTFFVELPVAAEEEKPSAEREERAPVEPAAGQSRILIIDDEPNVLDVLTKALIGRGYTVDAVGDGEDGLARLAESKFDVILCDFRMPGLSGMDFYRRIQSEKPHLASKIIFITGDTANLVTRRFVEENNLNILEKPFELPDLIQVIRLVGEKIPG
jgi:PAS domain S-box-containing protein